MESFMKKVMILVLVIFPTLSTATQLWGEDNSRSINDLMYLPEKDTAFFNFLIDGITEETELSYLSNPYSQSTTEGNSLSFVAGYSFLDNTGCSLEAKYYIKDRTETSYPNNTIDVFNSKGIADPILKIKHRLIDQKKQKINLDLKLSVSPQIGKAKIESTTKKGNELRGRTSLAFNVDAGKKYQKFQIKLGMFVEHFLKGKGRFLSNNSEIKYDTNTDWGMSGAMRYHIIKHLFTSIGLGFTFHDNKSYTNQGVKTTLDMGTTAQLALEAGFEIVPNKYLFEVQGLFAASDYDITSGTMIYNGDRDYSILTFIIKAQY